MGARSDAYGRGVRPAVAAWLALGGALAAQVGGDLDQRCRALEARAAAADGRAVEVATATEALLRDAWQQAQAEAAPRTELRLLLPRLRALVDASPEQRPRLALFLAPLLDLVGDWRAALAVGRTALHDLDQVPALWHHAARLCLQICLAHDAVADAWPLLAEVDQRLAGAPAAVAREFRMLRAELCVQVGLLEAAARALAAAGLTDARVGELSSRGPAARSAAEDAELGLHGDLLLAAERFDAAVAAALPLVDSPRGDARGRARICVAFARARQRQPAAAIDLLRGVVADDLIPSARRSRAAVELGLLALRSADLTGAGRWLAQFATRPPAELDARALTAVAWLCVYAERAGAPPPLALAAIRAAVQERFEFLLEQWDATPAAVEHLAFLQLSVRRDLLAVLCALVTQEAGAAAAAAECLRWWLAVEARGSVARHQADQSEVSVPAAQAYLAAVADCGLLYLPAPTGSLALSFVGGVGSVVELPPDVELRDQVRALRRAVAAADAAGWRDRLATVAQPVAAWALPPAIAARVAAAHSVAVFGDELLAGLPFAALPWSTGRAPFLGVAKAISTAPSLTLAVRQARQPAPTARGMALLAAGEVDAREAADYGVGAVALDASALSTLASALAAGECRIAPRATADDLLVDGAAGVGLTVVLAHGITASSHRPTNGLLLQRAGPRPGAVFAEDIAHAAGTVVLGVCGAGAAAVLRGEDGGHRFAHAFLNAGARAVVFADGDLALAPTLQLLAQFLRSLAAGASVAEALRAGREALATGAEYGHPAHFANLRVVGDGSWRVVLRGRPPQRPWLWLVGAVGAVAAGAAWWIGRYRRGDGGAGRCGQGPGGAGGVPPPGGGKLGGCTMLPVVPRLLSSTKA